ncbi:hypothetical protein BGX34_010387 [Mortierella sp. NVP85]|nr:hypothetical protein BGX34_010387 [Mortierella sp. NVP85]
MVRKLFNDLVTTLDIILDSSTVDLCVNHPSTCTLTGKVRIIAKRPCVYKSLVLTANGTTRMWNRQGSRTIKAKQVFLNTSKEIVYDNPHPAHQGGRPESMAFRRESLGGNTGSLSIQTRDAVDSGTAAAAPSASSLPRDNTDSPITHMTQSPAPTDLFEQPLPTEDSTAPDPGPTLAGSTNPTRNQLKQGVNDIVFTIEFPSHLHSKGEQQQQQQQPPTSSLSPSGEEQLCSLPSGPIKSTSGDSSITYTLSAVLVLSRRDILVNNHVATSIPFRVQNWQDTIEWRRSEDHSYHGKRRDKIEFQFQVPKQLDLRRLHELQFGFKGSWKTLQDNLKVKEMQYYIIEEEQQLMAQRTAPIVSLSVVSTSATHDCSIYGLPTNTWGHLRAVARLQIPQPNTVLETTSMPYPHTLSITHKLRVLIKFDQTLCKERDLQLSFPISIHPTLDEDGSPVHPDVNYVPRERRRRRRGHALYGIDTRQRSEDASDDDEAPLPMYADREDTLLLMVGQTADETAMEEALELAMAAAYPEGTTPHSPSEDSFSSISRSPISPLYPLVLTPIQGEQHAWGNSSRRSSLIPTSSPTHLTSPSPASRRHSHHGYPLDEPPPYVMPSRTEEPLPLTVHCPPSSSPPPHSFPQSPTSETSESGGPGDEDTSSIASPIMSVAEIFDSTTENSTHLGRLGSRIKKAIDKGKSRATGERGSRSVTVVTSSSSAASSSSSSANRSGPASSSSHTGSSSRPSPGLLPSPLYEIQEETLSYPGDDGCVRPLCTIPASRTDTCSSSSSESSSSSLSSPSSSSSSSDCSEPSPSPSEPRDQDKESTFSSGYVTTVYDSSCSTAR